MEQQEPTAATQPKPTLFNLDILLDTGESVPLTDEEIAVHEEMMREYEREIMDDYNQSRM